MDYFTAVSFERVLPRLGSRVIHKGHVTRDQYWTGKCWWFLLPSTSSLVWPGEYLCVRNSEPIQMVLDTRVMYDGVHAHAFYWYYSGQHLIMTVPD